MTSGFVCSVAPTRPTNIPPTSRGHPGFGTRLDGPCLPKSQGLFFKQPFGGTVPNGDAYRLCVKSYDPDAGPCKKMLDRMDADKTKNEVLGGSNGACTSINLRSDTCKDYCVRIST